MSLSEALKTTDLAMDAQDVEAFFLGALSADDPMPYRRALKELFLEDSKTPAKHDSPESRAKLEAALITLHAGVNRVRIVPIAGITDPSAGTTISLDSARSTA